MSLQEKVRHLKFELGKWQKKHEEEVGERDKRIMELEKQIALLSTTRWENLRYKRGQKQFLDWLDKHPRIKKNAERLMRFTESLESFRDRHIL